MKYGVEKCMENWLERVWKPIEIFGIGYRIGTFGIGLL